MWDILDKYLKIEDRNSINPKMFNSFVDGTKSMGIEMTAVCNATGLVPQSEGLGFPAGDALRARRGVQAAGGVRTLGKEGVTEVVSSVYRDGRDVPHHLALGTYVVFEGESDYARRCFSEYAMLPDSSGRYAALYRPIHMIGLELGVSVASAALRNEPTGAPTGSLRRRRHRQARGSRPARCSTARAASASGASRLRPSARWPRVYCRSGWRTTCGSSATSPRANV